MNEEVECFVVTKFDDDDDEREYLFVGTGINNPDDPERSTGRVHVFYTNDLKKCELVAVEDFPGVVLSMARYGNSIAFGVNGTVSNYI
jgi:hypothetical protein